MAERRATNRFVPRPKPPPNPFRERPRTITFCWYVDEEAEEIGDKIPGVYWAYFKAVQADGASEHDGRRV